jgi:hypothetical protein
VEDHVRARVPASLDAGRAAAGLGVVGHGHPDSLVDRLLRDAAHPPVVRGELSFTTDDFKPRWLPLPEGRFQLWFPPELVDYRKQAGVVTKRSTNKPGYWTQKRSELLGPYREALMEGQYVNPAARSGRR